MFGSFVEKCAAILVLAAVSTPLSLATTTSVHADITAESNASKRMNLAGRQRMLTQQLTRNACFVMAGVEPERFAERTETNVLQFDEVLQGLRGGDDALGILSETDPDILAALEEVETLWSTLGPAARQISAGDVHSIPMAQLITLNTSTLSHMHQTVVTMAKTYASPEISSSLLKTVNVAGRQRMLTQKVSKEACFKIIGLGKYGAPELVEATVQEFDDAMQALLSGSEADGIVPPPTPEVEAQLLHVNALWGDFKGLLEQINASEKVDQATKAQMANMSDEVLKEMHRAVLLYVE